MEISEGKLFVNLQIQCIYWGNQNRKTSFFIFYAETIFGKVKIFHFVQPKIVGWILLRIYANMKGSLPAWLLLFYHEVTAQKMKFSVKDSFSKCEQIHRKLRIWSHSVKKSLMENFIFCAVKYHTCS